LGITYTGVTDDTFKLLVQNNPTDSYYWLNGEGRFKWSWSGNATTGTVLGRIPAVPAMSDFSIEVDVSFCFKLYKIITTRSIMQLELPL
jgi:hypothetical protein